MLVPDQRCHLPSQAAPSKSPEDEELADVVGAAPAGPFRGRSHQRKPCQRLTGLREVRVVTLRPDRRSVIPVAAVGPRVDLEPFRHVVDIMLEEIPQHKVRLRPDFRKKETRSRHEHASGAH